MSFNSHTNQYSLNINPDKVLINSQLEGNENTNILNVASNINPNEDCLYNIGSSETHWKNIYVDTIHYSKLLQDESICSTDETNSVFEKLYI